MYVGRQGRARFASPGGGYPDPMSEPRPGTTQEPATVGSVVSGILTVILSLFCGLLAIPTGIVAVVLGIQGRRKSLANGQAAGLAIAGIALGAVGILITAAFWLSR